MQLVKSRLVITKTILRVDFKIMNIECCKKINNPLKCLYSCCSAYCCFVGECSWIHTFFSSPHCYTNRHRVCAHIADAFPPAICRAEPEPNWCPGLAIQLNWTLGQAEPRCTTNDDAVRHCVILSLTDNISINNIATSVELSKIGHDTLWGPRHHPRAF